MKRDEVFPSKWLKAPDLKGKAVTLTINTALYEVLKSPEGKEQGKTVLTFRGTGKELPLNMVNWDTISEIAGDDTDKWPGTKITVFPTTTTMKGKEVNCIRIRAPQQPGLPLAQAAAKPAPTPEPKMKPGPALADELDDEIPFN
jgi:hypothetical protein